MAERQGCLTPTETYYDDVDDDVCVCVWLSGRIHSGERVCLTFKNRNCFAPNSITHRRQTVSIKRNDLPPAHILEMTGTVKSPGLAGAECRVEVNWLGIRVQVHVMTCCTDFKICHKAHSQPVNWCSLNLLPPAPHSMNSCWNIVMGRQISVVGVKAAETPVVSPKAASKFGSVFIIIWQKTTGGNSVVQQTRNEQVFTPCSLYI